MNPCRIETTLKQFNKIGYSEYGMNRVAFTKEEEAAKELLISLCEKEGMKVKVDTCGNVIARYEGQNPESAPVIVGSHLDTVYNGGQFDGTVGVVLGLELIRSLKEKNISPQRPIEVICFASEESSRFGTATIGSKSITGQLNIDLLDKLIDQDGITFQKAIETVGLNYSNITSASRDKEEIHAFFEVHIEQGPVLEKERKKIGLVTAIAAPTRLKVSINGKASHSGTTPMSYRKDALLGASEIALAVEKIAKTQTEKGIVATVGECHVLPGAMNVVPGQAEMKIDIRGTDSTSKQQFLSKLEACFDDITARRQLQISYQLLSNEEPVKLDEKLIQSLTQTCQQLNVPYASLKSGAGHDTMNMAAICPAGLIFIPCKDGLSHHQDESATIDDIVTGGMVLEAEIMKWTQTSNDSHRGEDRRYAT